MLEISKCKEKINIFELRETNMYLKYIPAFQSFGFVFVVSTKHFIKLLKMVRQIRKFSKLNHGWKVGILINCITDDQQFKIILFRSFFFSSLFVNVLSLNAYFRLVCVCVSQSVVAIASNLLFLNIIPKPNSSFLWICVSRMACLASSAWFMQCTKRTRHTQLFPWQRFSARLTLIIFK